jgi:hypothetical protein
MASSITDAVSLVPLSSKKNPKKHRPGFRPVATKAKSSHKAHKDKTTTPSALKETKSNKNPDDDHSKLDEDTLEKVTTTTTIGAAVTRLTSPCHDDDDVANEKEQETTPTMMESTGIATNVTTISSTTHEIQNKEMLLGSGSAVDPPISSHQSSESSTKKNCISTADTTSSATKTTPSVRKTNEAVKFSTLTRRSSRKRKQTSHSSSIRIGSTREVTTFDVKTQEPRESETSQKEQEQNAAVAAATSVAAAAASTTSLAIVPVVSQDQAILDRLSAENAAGPKLSALTAFCSQFKTEKKKGDKRGGKRRKKNQVDDNKRTNEVSNAELSTSQKTPVGVPVVQIIDGEIVLQESSLMLPTRRTVQEVEEEFQDNVVEEDSQLAIIQATYTSFLTKGDAAANGGKRGPQHWSLQETQKFYVALRQLGTDFGSMVTLFDGKRTRRQLKHKYRSELAKNPSLVQELALNPKFKADIGKFGLQLIVAFRA